MNKERNIKNISNMRTNVWYHSDFNLAKEINLIVCHSWYYGSLVHLFIEISISWSLITVIVFELISLLPASGRLRLLPLWLLHNQVISFSFYNDQVRLYHSISYLNRWIDTEQASRTYPVSNIPFVYYFSIPIGSFVSRSRLERVTSIYVPEEIFSRRI